MKTITNIVSIIDYSGSEPVTLYSNAVQTLVRTPQDDGVQRVYRRNVGAYGRGLPFCGCECCESCCRRCNGCDF